MNATIIRPPAPPVPPATVTLTMTEREAKILLTLAARLSGNEIYEKIQCEVETNPSECARTNQAIYNELLKLKLF